jgi:hypothetical protein
MASSPPPASSLPLKPSSNASLSSISVPTAPVQLNVGGHRFTTTRETLLSVPDTLFHPLLSDRFQTSKDEQGAIFIDRDGQVRTFSTPLIRYLGCILSESTVLQAFWAHSALVLRTNPHLLADERRQYSQYTLTARCPAGGSILSHWSAFHHVIISFPYACYAGPLIDALESPDAPKSHPDPHALTDPWHREARKFMSQHTDALRRFLHVRLRWASTCLWLDRLLARLYH